jgi:hypothetical protein
MGRFRAHRWLCIATLSCGDTSTTSIPAGPVRASVSSFSVSKHRSIFEGGVYASPGISGSRYACCIQNPSHHLINFFQAWCTDSGNMGRYAIHGRRVAYPPHFYLLPFTSNRHFPTRGYLNSCRDIVTGARTIANAITSSIPELYVLGSPPASVVAFASKHPKVNVMEVGDVMAHRGWHLNALTGPAAVHIACTVSLFDDLCVIGVC